LKTPAIIVAVITTAVVTHFGTRLLIELRQTEIDEHTPAPKKQDPDEKLDDKSLVSSLLQQDLGTRQFDLPTVIEGATGHQLLGFSGETEAHRAIHEAITSSCSKALLHFSATDSPIRKLRRINEASAYFESYLREEINRLEGFTCEIPKNPKGNEQRAGYPDLLITHIKTDTKAYLDPKLYEAKSERSSLRTFYYEPRTHTQKVHHTALHLLIGIRHDGNEGAWNFDKWTLVDLSKMKVRLKAEFQTSNRGLYHKSAVISELKDSD